MRLRARLAQSRSALATMLRQRYTADKPDVVSVVLDAKGFADVLERIEFLRRVQHSDTMIVDAVRRGRDDARHDERLLAALEPRQREQTAAVASQRDALARMTAALQSRRAALAQARAARLAALSNTIASRRRAEHELSRLLAVQARAAASQGPGGPWSIPWPIVECESGGQNLPPNYAERLGLLPDARQHLARARRQHPARLPGLEGRAGPPRREAVGGRGGRAQLGLRRARRHLKPRPAVERACTRRRYSAPSAPPTMSGHG